MSGPSLPAYLRLPDGLRLAGAATIDRDGVLVFAPKQAMSPVPPSGLPVSLVVAGLPDDEDAQVTVAGSIDIVNARQVGIVPDAPVPRELRAVLAPAEPEPEPAATALDLPEPLERAFSQGLDLTGRAMRRFLMDLGDHLFDLATSSRYGSAGRQIHYDALNQLKRGSDDVASAFLRELRASLAQAEKEQDEETTADLAQTSARSLNLVGLEEIDQKLAVDKIVNAVADRCRVDLESLTIRAAALRNVDPQVARTPFHPTHILRAFVSSLEQITDDADVTRDITEFFGTRFSSELDGVYRAINKSLADDDVEPDLEERIRDVGSLLHPPEKRIVKSRVHRDDEAAPDDAEAPPAPEPEPVSESEAAQRPSAPAASDAPGAAAGHPAGGDAGAGSGARDGARPGAAAPPADGAAAPSAGDLAPTSGQTGAPAGAPRTKHDAMYDAVIAALDAQRGREEAALTGAARATAGAPDGAAATADDAAPAAPARVLDEAQIAEALRAMQSQQPQAGSLSELPALNSLLTQAGAADGDAPVQLDPESANRLSFVDNVFQTLNTSFDVSQDMEPSIARLRVPLARLALQEPRFFTQPDHPAHRLLDKLSMLAGSDQSVNRNLQKKVAEIVDEVAQNYDGDPAVFEGAQQRLDGLLDQRERVLDKSVQRVISALEGQEKLGRAQRQVEKLLTDHLDEQATPAALQQLLDSGWRSALVQLALREGEDSMAWREESALLDKLLEDMRASRDGQLPDTEKREMQLRLRALSKRLGDLNPGSVAHEDALRRARAVLDGEEPVETAPYRSPVELREPPTPEKVEQLPRLKRWVQRASELQPGARLRYVDKEGKRRQMELVWVSDDRNRYAFVNERGQKIAEMTLVQLARQLSRGATPPTNVDKMSVLDQSMYNTLEKAQQTLSFDRNRDQLTRLINSDSLMAQVDRSLHHAQRRGAEHAFGLLDIDNFSLVNEVFDETSGDEVLVEFSKLLSQMNDRRALTARMDDDEFGVLLTYRSANEAREIGEKIRKDIAASSLNVGGDPVSFTVSMGIAPIEQTTPDRAAVVDHARAALQTAKEQGRDQVVLYNPDHEEVVAYKRDREASRQRLEEAMSTDRLVLRAQPIVQSAMDGSTDARHHYEVLLSLRDDEGNLLSPQDFITSAERFGFISMVDRWVVREVFTWISSLVDKQKVVPELSINLSGTSITDNDFLEYILEQISEFGVGTSRLVFEITETGAIDNLPRAADFVRTLKNLGCKFSLDDFGTGLASHIYLRELPVDYVKIDGTFISNIHVSETDYAMAKSINDLAHFLGQKTVAECVETLDNIPALREIGVDYLQGWGVGMPRRLTEITEDLPALET